MSRSVKSYQISPEVFMDTFHIDECAFVYLNKPKYHSFLFHFVVILSLLTGYYKPPSLLQGGKRNILSCLTQALRFQFCLALSCYLILVTSGPVQRISSLLPTECNEKKRFQVYIWRCFQGGTNHGIPCNGRGVKRCRF